MSSKAASRHKRYDFFTRHFPGINLSDWKMLEDAMKKVPATRTTTTAAE